MQESNVMPKNKGAGDEKKKIVPPSSNGRDIHTNPSGCKTHDIDISAPPPAAVAKPQEPTTTDADTMTDTTHDFAPISLQPMDVDPYTLAASDGSLLPPDIAGVSSMPAENANN